MTTITDVIGARFGGKVDVFECRLFGHDKNDYSNQDNGVSLHSKLANSELFAGYCSARLANNTEALKVLQRYLPNAFKQCEFLFEQCAKLSNISN